MGYFATSTEGDHETVRLRHHEARHHAPSAGRSVSAASPRRLLDALGTRRRSALEACVQLVNGWSFQGFLIAAPSAFSRGVFCLAHRSEVVLFLKDGRWWRRAEPLGLPTGFRRVLR